ncbi:hypothetical protein ACFL0Z_01160, partial [Patescibacteria group bacterium]
GKDALRARKDRQVSEAEEKAKKRSSDENRRNFNSRIGSPTERMASAMQMLEDNKNGKLKRPLTSREINSMQTLFKTHGGERGQARFRDQLMHTDAGAATAHIADRTKRGEAMEKHFRQNGYDSQSPKALKNSSVAKAAMNAMKDEDLGKGPKAQKDALVEGMQKNYDIAKAAKGVATTPQMRAKAEKNQIDALKKIGAASGSIKHGSQGIQGEALKGMTGKQIGKLKADGADKKTLDVHMAENMNKLPGVAQENPALAKEYRDGFDKRAETLQEDYEKVVKDQETKVDTARSRGTASEEYRKAQADLDKLKKSGVSGYLKEEISKATGNDKKDLEDEQKFYNSYRRNMGSPVARG